MGTAKFVDLNVYFYGNKFQWEYFGKTRSREHETQVDQGMVSLTNHKEGIAYTVVIVAANVCMYVCMYEG